MRPKKRITGSSRVYLILRFMTFRECCVFGLHLWFYMFECTVLWISKKGDGKEWKRKSDEIPSHIELHLSTPESTKINLDVINFNIYPEINSLWRWDIIMSKKTLSRFYSVFLKYVKCRTIRFDIKIWHVWEVTPNGIHLTLFLVFEVLLPIYKNADLKVIKRIEKLREES